MTAARMAHWPVVWKAGKLVVTSAFAKADRMVESMVDSMVAI